MARILGLRFPAWSIQRVRAERTTGAEAAEAAHRALLIRRRDARRGDCVAACCPVARRVGVREGMPLSEALALIQAAERKASASKRSRPVAPPALPPEVWGDDPAADQRALQQLAEALERFSPIVGWETESAGASGDGGGIWEAAAGADRALWLDVTGIGGLFGGEESLLREALDECRRRGYVAQGVIAGSIGAAWGATCDWEAAGERRERVIAANDTEAALAATPLRGLRIESDVVETLRQLGVTRIEQLSQLPRPALVTRFGPGLLRRLDQARGLAAERIRPFRPPPQCAAEQALDEPTRDERALGAVLSELLDRLAAQLAPRNRGVVQLAVRLDVAGGPPRCVRLDLFRPSASPRHWEELVRLRWERLDGGGAVGRMTVEASLTAPLERRQQDLFATGARGDDREWGGLLERLTSRVGPDGVLAAVLRREGLPERDFEYRPWLRWRRETTGETTVAKKVRQTRAAVRRGGGDSGGAAETEGGEPAPAAVCYRPLLVDERPRPLETLAVVPHGPPASFRWEGTWRRVERWWGPERIETGWWRGPSIRRDYFRVETTTGDRWWIFRDLRADRWYLHGSFD